MKIPIQTLTPKMLTQQNFARFGEVISTNHQKPMVINEGYAQKYANLATLDAQDGDGRSAVHVYVAQKRDFPLKIEMLEKHPHFSQAFIATSNHPFLSVVAPESNTAGIPDLEQIEAFMTDGDQGVNYARGTWHFPLISLMDDERFIVLDRVGNDATKTISECVEYAIEDKMIWLKLKKQ